MTSRYQWRWKLYQRAGWLYQESWTWEGWEWILMLLAAGQPPGQSCLRELRSKPPLPGQLELPFPQRPIRGDDAPCPSPEEDKDKR